ncbi:hypothetical protein DSECCO2_317350 [anaerobic digester metagenome]
MIGRRQVRRQRRNMLLTHLDISGESSGRQDHAFLRLDIPGLAILVLDPDADDSLISGGFTVDLGHGGFKVNLAVGLGQKFLLDFHDVCAHAVFRCVGTIAVMAARAGNGIPDLQAVVEHQVEELR